MVMCGRACVYTNVYNVYGKELAMLRKSHMQTANSIVKRMISSWNQCRAHTGNLPPHGWPLSLLMFFLAVFATMGMCVYGYKNKFWKHNSSTIKNKMKVNAAVYQSEKDGASLESKAISFDADV